MCDATDWFAIVLPYCRLDLGRTFDSSSALRARVLILSSERGVHLSAFLLMSKRMGTAISSETNEIIAILIAADLACAFSTLATG